MQALRVPSALDSSLLICDLKRRRKESALAELVARAAEAGAVRWPDALADLIAVREAVVSSALGHGVAVVAVRSLAVIGARLVLGRSPGGIRWGMSTEPVRLVALVLSPADRPLASHLGVSSRIVGLLRHSRGRERLLRAISPEDFALRAREALS